MLVQRKQNKFILMFLCEDTMLIVRTARCELNIFILTKAGSRVMNIYKKPPVASTAAIDLLFMIQCFY